jgi:hypothetical protein
VLAIQSFPAAEVLVHLVFVMKPEMSGLFMEPVVLRGQTEPVVTVCKVAV